MKRAVHIALALLAATSSGCSFAIDSMGFVENTCQAQSDCPAASTCDIGLGVCVAAPDETLEVGLEVVLPSSAQGEPPASFTFPTEHVDGTSKIDVSLPAPITVIGNVRAPGVDGPIPVDITFIRTAAFDAGPSAVTTITSLPEARLAADMQSADYAASLVPDRDYDVLVEPIGDAITRLPPLRGTIKTPDDGDVFRFDIEFPELAPVAGTVVHTGITGLADEPVAGLHVRAVDLEGRVISSTGITDEHGGFTLAIDASRGSYLLRVGAGSDRPDFPTFTVDPSYAFPGEALRILVPQLTPIRYVGRVERSTTTGIPGPVADAVVTLQSDDVYDDATGVRGSFRTTVRSGRDGTFEANVLPGTYEVVVTPGAADDLGVLATSGVAILSAADGNETRGQAFALNPRAAFRGEVVTSDERVISGASVQANAISVEDEDRGPDDALVARHNRSSDAVTDESGAFVLRLDIGGYDLSIKPPSESGYPWIVSPELVIGFVDDTIADRFEFEAPVPVTGVVRDASGALAPGAEVRAYGIVHEGDTERSVLLGRAITDEEGAYMLLLPPRL